MATNAITALGTVLTFNSNTIGEVMSLSGNRSCNMNEIVSCDSTDNCKERIAGIIDEGDYTIHIVYDGSAAGVYNDLNTDFLAQTSSTLLITYSDTSSHSVTALISSLGLPSFGSGDGSVEVDVTFSSSGKATFTDVP